MNNQNFLFKPVYQLTTDSSLQKIKQGAFRNSCKVNLQKSWTEKALKGKKLA